jgi:hypothetical protein
MPMITWISEEMMKQTSNPTDFDWESMVSIANLSFSVEVVEWVYEKCPKKHWRAPDFMPFNETEREEVVAGKRHSTASILCGLAMYGDIERLKKLSECSEYCYRAIVKGALVGGHRHILEWIREAPQPRGGYMRKSTSRYIQEYVHARKITIHPAAVKWLLEKGNKFGVGDFKMLMDPLIREGDLNALKQLEIRAGEWWNSCSWFSCALSLGQMGVVEWLEEEAPQWAREISLEFLYESRSEKEAKISVDEVRWVVKHDGFYREDTNRYYFSFV